MAVLVSVLPPCQSLPTSVQMAATATGHAVPSIIHVQSTMPSARTQSHGGPPLGPNISSMPITIVAPPTVLRCSSAASRRGSAVSTRVPIINSAYQQKPPPYLDHAVETSREHRCSDPSGDPIEQTPLRFPKLDSLPKNVSSNAKASTSDSVLVRTSSNKVDSEISSQTKLGSPVKDDPRGSVFPNFRILQRLATSARLRSAKKNALIHLNASRRSADSSDSEKQNNSGSDLSDASEKLQSATIQASGFQKAFAKVDYDSGLSSLISPTSDEAKDEAYNGAFDDDGCNESTTSSPKKEKRARKKRPLSVRLKLKRRTSTRRSKSKSSTPITASSIGGKMGSVAVPGLGPISMMVEPTKVEIYSSRYNKRKQEEKKTIENNVGVPQGSRSWSKSGESNSGVGNSLEASNLVTLRSLTQATLSYGSSSKVQVLPGGHNRRKVAIENKFRKIFLSEKQSSSIRECGVMMPCAPPATPMPETLQTVEYVPSLSDLRSQRAIKTRLTSMEKDAKEKRQRRLEEAKKLDRQLQRDHVALKKFRQRQEIYALNKVMTELELNNFHEFCEKIKNVSDKDEKS